jgi:signal transduction histidine kinase
MFRIWFPSFFIMGVLSSLLVFFRPFTDPASAGVASVALLIGFLCVGERVSRVSTRRMEKHVRERLARLSRELEQTKAILNRSIFQLAHTLRTPLNNIRWAAEIVKNEETGEVGARQRESLDTLERSAVSVLRLLHDLQDILVLGTRERIRLSPVDCRLDQIVDEVAGAWAVAARRKNIRFIVTHPPGGLSPVPGDPSRLRQVVDDLIENAVRYTPNGGQVMVATGRDPSFRGGRDRAPLRVCVRDSGIGIPSKDQRHVFEKFFRASNAHTQWVDGAGVGLTLAQSLVRAHGGRVWFSSTEGKGSTFCFTIPVVHRPPSRGRRRTNKT